MRRVPVREEWLDDYFKTLVISFENDEYAEAGGSKTSGKHEILLKPPGQDLRETIRVRDQSWRSEWENRDKEDR